MWKDKLFWFSQPSVVLNTYDNNFMWFFLILTVLGVLVRIAFRFVTGHPVLRKIANKFANAFWVTGLIGLLWYGFRYENTPFFADRYWVLLIGLVFVIRLVYIFKYWFTDFRAEKSSFDKMQLNSKYIPGKK